jgi:protein TonB
MKSLLTALILLCSVSVNAQDTIRSFFDKKGDPVDLSFATYFAKRTTNGLDYYQLRPVPAESRDKNFIPAIHPKEGNYVFIDPSGRRRKEVSYHNDLRQGVSKHFVNNRLSDSLFYKNDSLDGSCVYFHPNGNISSIELYIADSLISFELFNEDGSSDLVSESPNRLPEFPGGMYAMKLFLSQNIQYPDDAVALGIEGKCFVTFIVDPNGKISFVKIARGVPDCPECDAEAVRVVNAMPDWVPGKNHNRYVDSYFNLPVHFKLVSGRKLRKEKKRGR